MITYESMAMAAGEDDADKFKSGGVLTCSASVQDSGRGSLYKYQEHDGGGSNSDRTWRGLAGNPIVRVETCVRQ
jgi:hypothetical protein